jgi:hypothetical protein
MLKVGTKQSRVRFEVFTAVTMNNAVFRDVAPCRFCMNRRFGATYQFHIQGKKSPRAKNQREQVAADCGFFYPEDGGDTFLRNVGSDKIYTAHTSQKTAFFKTVPCYGTCTIHIQMKPVPILFWLTADVVKISSH